MNIDAVPQSFDALFDTDQWKGGSLHFAFQSSGAPTFHVNGYGAAKSSTAFTAADIGRWVHIAVTYDSTTGAMSSYRDGRPDGNHAVARGCAIDLGGSGSNIGSWNTGRYFDGKLDDFRVYARALSAAEVRALAAGR